jgi:hypothetical protein
VHYRQHAQNTLNEIREKIRGVILICGGDNKIKKFIDNQKRYCEENNLPFFMPEDGVCWSCGNPIIDDLRKMGYGDGDVRLVTGCPICHRSYCD